MTKKLIALPLVIALFLLGFLSLPYANAAPLPNDNAVWIVDSWTTTFNQLGKTYVMNNASAVVEKLNTAGITNVYWLVGYWGPSGTLTYTRTDQFITDTLAVFDAANIDVWAWLINFGDAPQFNTAQKRSSLVENISACAAKGFDGVHNDIELPLNDGNIDNFVSLNVDAAAALHSSGKLYGTAIGVGLLWKDGASYNLAHALNGLDKITFMFYDEEGSYFNPATTQTAYINSYFQEVYGLGTWSSYGVPASSTQIGIMVNCQDSQYNTAFTLQNNLAKITELITTYGTPSTLDGFCLWIYEYMSASDFSNFATWNNGETPIQAAPQTFSNINPLYFLLGLGAMLLVAYAAVTEKRGRN